MKTGRSIVELAQELQRRAEAKADYVADTRSMQVEVMGTEETPVVALHVEGTGFYAPTGVSHGQIAAHTDIPKKYYDRLLGSAPQLLATNVNHWFRDKPARRMVRTLDGRARAFLSDRYRRFDNEDVAESVLPVLLEDRSIQVVSTEVTDLRLYIKALFPKVENEIKVGDPVQAGIVISNSEVGLGSLSVQPLVFRLVCTNGMISQDYGINRYHVGRRIDGDGMEVSKLFRDETLAADDRALALKLQDVVRGAMDPGRFGLLVERMRESTLGPAVGQPVAAVEVLAKKIGLRDGEKGSVLENLIRGQDYSRWGVLNAVTALANTHDSCDRATELESAGGLILDLHPSEWSEIALAEAA
ncbi:DUF932 domain-containing protein [Methylococcus mesophilus]|uniref:DUF932 domain-containing protein n=1 Tax=Methylococcus mesophilus TaxID=2993564 RepID=UPI00224B28B0|nr:DUF932 domain-containing protein [Methylococcus mesophilus]UZR29045.1 DUF932 domain-containing protein [Methylococcus mesophilus]